MRSRRERGWRHRGRIISAPLAEALIPEQSSRLLEIGYGSGLFMPRLARREVELHGVDTNDMADR